MSYLVNRLEGAFNSSTFFSDTVGVRRCDTDAQKWLVLISFGKQVWFSCMCMLTQSVPFGILKKKKSALLSTAFSLLTREIIISCKPLLLLIRVRQGVCHQGARAGTHTCYCF